MNGRNANGGWSVRCPMGSAEKRNGRMRCMGLAGRVAGVVLVWLAIVAGSAAGQSWETIGHNMSDVIVGLDTSTNRALVFAVDASSGDIKAYDAASGTWTRVGGPGAEFAVAEAGRLYAVTSDRRWLVQHVSGGNWAWIREGTKDVIGSQGGAYAIDAASGDILWHDTAGGWTRIGGPGTQFVAGSGTSLYALAMDGSTPFRYEAAQKRWTKIGEGFDELVSGGTKLFGIQADSGDIYEFSGTPMNWTRIGGPGKAFTADFNGQLYALGLDGAVIFSYSGTPGAWNRIGGPAETIVAGGGRLCAINTSGDLSVYMPAESSPLGMVPLETVPLPGGLLGGTSGDDKGTILEPVPIPGLGEMLYHYRRNQDPIVRAQFFILVSGNDHAGTDDPIGVSLNPQNGTWLDYGRDDFEAWNAYTYDLNLKGLRTFEDIQYLNIYMKEFTLINPLSGTTGVADADGLCIQQMGLVINGETVYYKDFVMDGGHWLDNEDPHKMSFRIPRSELTSSPYWKARTEFVPPVPYVITREELESRIESIVGHLIHYESDLSWEGDGNDGHWVEVYYVDDDTLGVDLDLQVNVDYELFDEDLWVDINLHMDVSCAGGEYYLDIYTYSHDTEGSVWTTIAALLDPVTAVITTEIQDYLEDEYLPDISFAQAVDSAILRCVPFHVTKDGNLIIGY